MIFEPICSIIVSKEGDIVDYSVEKRNRYLKMMIEYQSECLKNDTPCTLIGDRVKFFREELGLGKSTFAKHAGINRSSLHKIENNTVIPSLKLLCKIVDALNVNGYGFVLTKEQFEKEYLNIIVSDNDPYNIYKLQDEICKEIETKVFCYYTNKKIKIFPQKYLDLLKKNIIASFSVLNLIPHDEEQGETYCITGPGPQEDLMRLLREMKKNDLIF